MTNRIISLFQNCSSFSTRLVVGLLASILLLFLAASGHAQSQARQITMNPKLEPFYHGVASGDPLPHAVVIWTRVTPDSASTGPIVVNWRVATDTGMTQVVQSGSLLTDASQDYTVKIDVQGLQPDTYYYYEFTALNERSIRGRTKTAPAGSADSMRFAVVSCANFEAGYFNAYRSIKQRNDLDAVIHLGDYIYEYQTGGYAPNPNTNRDFQPSNEIFSLTDYRTRYSGYKLDKDLIRLHQQFPWIVVWDDHESANDSWEHGASNHQPAEGPWSVRKQAAIQAYHEWLPIRPVKPNNQERIFRKLQFGNLLNLYMLDTRLYGRDEQSGTSGPTVTDSTRTILGKDQFQWLTNSMDTSNAQWNILGQQVMIAPLDVAGIAFNEDQWDGYKPERQQLFDYVLANNIGNFAVLTGDIHTSWANDLPGDVYDGSTGAGSVGVEFITPSVTSPGSPIPVGTNAIKAANSHMKYIDLTEHGYIVLDVNQQRAQADWYYVNTLDQRSGQFYYGSSWYVNAGERHLNQTNAAARPRESLPYQQAPKWPRTGTIPSDDDDTTVVDPPDTTDNDTTVTDTAVSIKEPSQVEDLVLTGLYPNPANDYVIVQYFTKTSEETTIELYNIAGQVVKRQKTRADHQQGMYKAVVDLAGLSKGKYIVTIKNGRATTSQVVVKE